jgi:mannose-1-phosphate guanylyltransferase
MKAFVLAGGLGTRLKPRFGDLPKPLAPLKGRPFLEHQLDWLRNGGIVDVVLCVGHGADRVLETLGDGSRLGVRLTYSAEDEPLGTAGALRLARRWVDGPAIVVNGDTLPEADPWWLERVRWERGWVGAVALFETSDAGSRGRVECDAEGRVLRFVEKDPSHRGAAWVNGGLYAFSSSLWRSLPEGAASLERDVLPGLAEAGRLGGVPLAGTFYDIGTPAEWERAERHLTT